MRSKTGIHTLVFLAFLVLLLLMDTAWGRAIPQASKWRLAFPAILMLGFVTTPRDERRPYLSVLLASFVAIGALSSFLGNSLLLGAVKLALYVCVIYPLLRSSRIHEAFMPGARGLDLLLGTAYVLLALNCLMALGTGSGIFNNPNQLGLFVVVVLPLALYRMEAPGTRKERALGAIAVLLCIALAILSRSRGSAAAILATGLGFFSLRHSASRAVIVGNVAVMLVAGGLLLTFSDSMRERAVGFAYKGDKTVVDGTRRMKFDETMVAFRERPLVGYGFGLSWLVDKESEHIAFRNGRLSWVVGEFGNSTLAMLSGGGLALAVVMYSMIGAVLFGALQALQRSRRGTAEYAFIAALTAGVGGMLVNAQAEAWLMAPMTHATVFFWLYCGLLLHASHAPALGRGLAGARRLIYVRPAQQGLDERAVSLTRP